MRFYRAILKDWIRSLMDSADSERCCLGNNFLIEENVSDVRRLELEAHQPDWTDAKELLRDYYLEYVQCHDRGILPSTFNWNINMLALQSVVVHPSRKLIRLERIDDFLNPVQDGIDYVKLLEALNGGDQDPLFEFAARFRSFPGERPTFAGFMSDVRHHLGKKDWLPYIIDSFGLYHNYPYDPGKPNCFALMEYAAAEVLEQARRKGIKHCFAVPTVLDVRFNPAFCPVPRSTGHGYAVDLRGNVLARPVREILHIRFDCSPRHVKRFGV